MTMGLKVSAKTGDIEQVEGLPPPDPAELLEVERAAMVASRMQARIALHQEGLLTQIEQAVAQADPVVQIAWQDATIFERQSPTIAALAASIGLTDEQLDDLFRAAMTIKA